VFIIDEAELLAREGQNILLKTLEEPPAGTCILLVTAHEQRLLPTVRSRCQRVAFGPLDEEAVRRWLDEQEDAAELGEAERARIVRFARGSLGRAELALTYRLDEWSAAIEPLVNRVAAGQADHRLGTAMADRVEDLAKRWTEQHKGASKDAANKAAVRQMLGLMGELCRVGLRQASEAPDGSDGGHGEADPAALEGRAEPWLIGVDLIQEAERHLETNVSPALLLDELAVEWAHRAGGSQRAAH
jgi:DNA polymerase-3 subunit delta'